MGGERIHRRGAAHIRLQWAGAGDANGVSIRQSDPQRVRQVEEELGLGDTPMFLFVGQIN